MPPLSSLVRSPQSSLPQRRLTSKWSARRGAWPRRSRCSSLRGARLATGRSCVPKIRRARAIAARGEHTMRRISACTRSDCSRLRSRARFQGARARAGAVLPEPLSGRADRSRSAARRGRRIAASYPARVQRRGQRAERFSGANSRTLPERRVSCVVASRGRAGAAHSQRPPRVACPRLEPERPSSRPSGASATRARPPGANFSRAAAVDDWRP